MPWGPNLMGELPLTCVGLDRAGCCFPTRSLQAWRTEKFFGHMRSSELGVCGVRGWCEPSGGGSRAGGAESPRVVGTGHRKDALLGAGCSTAASRSCTAWRHRDDHHCLCRIPYWRAERGNTIHRLACEPGRNVPFKTAWEGFLFRLGFPVIPRRGILFLLLQAQKWSECWGNGCRGAARALQEPVCQQLHPPVWDIPPWEGELCGVVCVEE